MSLNRKHLGLAAVLWLLATGLPAAAQETIRDLPAMQLFDEADVRPYGNWAAPRDGIFFAFDGIFWSINAPSKTTIGVPGLPFEIPPVPPATVGTTVESNLTTGDFRAKWKSGNRMEGGIIFGHHGLLISGFELNRQTMHIAAQGVNSVFLDPSSDTGTALEFQDAAVSLVNRVKPKSIEVMYMYRTHQLHHGGTLEWLLGGRYFYFDDDFAGAANASTITNVTDPVTGDVTTFTTDSTSYWELDAKNRIAGPQIGLRWAMPFGRFRLSTEGRFMAGINSQTLRERGVIGASTTSGGTEPSQPVAGFLVRNSTTLTEFAPLVEFRVQAHVQATRLIQLNVGYNALYMDGIARAANMIDYRLPQMGILTENNRGSVIMHGLTLGIEMNR